MAEVWTTIAASALDWDDLRYFLAVARHGTLSSAARELGVTQPTVGRRIDACERRLGAKLFWRSQRGLALTDSGRAVLVHVERMSHHAVAAERAALRLDEELAGTLRLTASEWLVDRVLCRELAPFLTRHPKLSVEIIADARWLNLPARDADVALRPARFRHRSVYQRKVARIGFGLYASHDYLAARGLPDVARRCEGHVVIAMVDREGAIADTPWIRDIAADARVAARCNGRDGLAAMAAAGVGLACLPRLVGDATPELRLLPPEPPERTLWVGVHRETRSAPPVRALIDALDDVLAALAPVLYPAPAGDTWQR